MDSTQKQFAAVNKLVDFVAQEAVKEVGRIVFDKIRVGWRQPQTGSFGSPVLTGRFYTSHRVALGSKDSSVTPENVGSESSPLPKLTFQYYDRSVQGFKIGTDIIISNSLDYAVDLEEGFSRKTPSGVYRVSVEAAKVQIISGGLPRTKKAAEGRATSVAKRLAA